MELRDLQKQIHDNAIAHGWWDRHRPIPELLCLIHSEASEALEAYRNGNNENLKEELADIVIRVLDMAGGYGINLEEEVMKKHETNKSRPYRHGDKLA